MKKISLIFILMLLFSSCTETFTVTVEESENGKIVITDEDGESIKWQKPMKAGTLLKISVQADSGYGFLKWENDVLKGQSQIVTLSGDLKLKAIFSKLIQLTFKPNGGEGDDRVEFFPQGKIIKPSEYFIHSNPKYKFMGWSENASASWDEGIEEIQVTSVEKIFYAVWDGPYYKLSFDGNGANGFMGDQELVKGRIVRLTSNKFSKPGEGFKGWTTNKDSSTVEYSDEDNFTIGEADVTLYALWGTAVTLSFNMKGAPCSGIADKIYGKNSEIILPTVESEGDSFLFFGWSENESAETVTHYFGSTYTITGDTTFYLVYKEALTLSFDGNNADSGSMDDVVDLYEGKTITLPINTFERIGYVFRGWLTYKTSLYPEPQYDDGGPFTMIDEDEILYALWYEALKIHFDGNGADSGSMDDIENLYRYQEDIPLSKNNFQRAHHTFLGWATYVGASTIEYEDEALLDMGLSGKTLYAVWDPDPTVTLKDKDGNVIDSFQVLKGSKLTKPQDPVGINKGIFRGWTYFDDDNWLRLWNFDSNTVEGDLELKQTFIEGNGDLYNQGTPSAFYSYAVSYLPCEGSSNSWEHFYFKTRIIATQVSSVLLGCDTSTQCGATSDNPFHYNTLSPYYCSEIIVEEDLWRLVMDTFDDIDWYGAVAFCNRLTTICIGKNDCVYFYNGNPYTKEDAINKRVPTWNTSKKGFRLPIGDEWEYAAKDKDTYNLSDFTFSNGYAWCWDEDPNNSFQRLQRVVGSCGSISYWIWGNEYRSAETPSYFYHIRIVHYK